MLSGIVLLFTLWEVSLAWRWYQQSIAFIFAAAVLYYLLIGIRRFGNLPALLPDWVTLLIRANPRPLTSPLSFFALFSGLILLFMGYHFRDGISLSECALSIHSKDGSRTLYSTQLPDFQILPFDLPCLLKEPEPFDLHISGYVAFPESGQYRARLSSSSGETLLFLDGRELDRITDQPGNRIALPIREISPGWHRLDIRHSGSGTPPGLNLSWSHKQKNGEVPVRPRLVRDVENCIHPWRIFLAKLVFTVFLTIGLGLALSVGVSWVGLYLQRWSGQGQRSGQILAFVMILVGVLVGRGLLLQYTGAVIEADEAAFGLMAQRLLRGELPPIFHYGQAYQGIAEVIPLAFLMRLLGETPWVLKLEPCLMYLAFSLLVLFLYWRIGRNADRVSLLLMLICSPVLLMWISLKAWFGYAETLFAGAAILASTYKLVYRPGRFDLYRTLLLGFVGGVSLYVLPFSAPVVLSSFLFILWCRKSDRWKISLLAASVLLVTAIPPYLIHDLTSEAKSMSFLVKGRELGAPRVAGERAFLDRFLNECFPVIAGGRAIYDDQREIPFDDLPRVLYLITTAGLLLLPFYLREDWRALVRDRIPGRFLLILPSALAAPIGVLSPFGIWPWYFLPVYFGLPVVWGAAFYYLSRYCRPAAIAAVCVCLAVWAAGSTTRSELLFQPASLVKTGVTLRTDNKPLIDALQSAGISHAICDQGADFATQSTGRDWMGERLTFESGMRINAIDSLTRRHPHLVADTATANRVAYIFRRTYEFMDFNHLKDPGYQPVTFERLAALFGPHYLIYDRVDSENDVLFLPPIGHPSNGKGLWKVTTNREADFISRLHDHSISSRAYGPTYWTSGVPQTPGDFILIDTGRIMPMRGIVMYHGVKTLDRPYGAMVSVSQDGAQWWQMGPVGWDPGPSVSYWRHVEEFKARYIRVELTESHPEFWWTIYELWLI
ncbi:MAG TPA: hypothetical protein PLQ35_01690 [bacterium]|nr:hypothetical protein [bacterium]HQL60982.1 hypothetical protein [bacterium]